MILLSVVRDWKIEHHTILNMQHVEILENTTVVLDKPLRVYKHQVPGVSYNGTLPFSFNHHQVKMKYYELLARQVDPPEM